MIRRKNIDSIVTELDPAKCAAVVQYQAKELDEGESSTVNSAAREAGR